MSTRTKWVLIVLGLIVLLALVYHGPGMGF